MIKLLDMISNKYIADFQIEYLQDLTLHWLLNSLVTPKGRIPVEQPISDPTMSSYRPNHGYLKRQTPGGICALVLTIPRSTVQKIKTVLLERHITINLNVLVINPDGTFDVFRSIQPVFGKLKESEDGETGTIEQDFQGWYGTADFQLCLYIPTLICLCDDPRSIRVAVRMENEKVAYECFRRYFGNDLQIFNEKLLNIPSVHVFESLPGIIPPRSSWNAPNYPESAVKTEIFTVHFPRVDIQRSEFSQLVHINLDEAKRSKSKPEINVKQTSSCTVLVTCGDNQQVCTFPFPITDVRHKIIRVGSIEITAALVTPSNCGYYASERFPLVRLSNSTVASWNLPYINFSKLDRLDVPVYRV